MKKYQQGGYPLPNFWEAGLESLNFDMYKDAFDARGEYSNAFQNQQNAIQPPAPPKKSIWAKRNERRRGEYVDALKEYNDKKDLATNSFKQSYNMMLPLGMLMQGQQGYMDYLNKPKENLQMELGFNGFKMGGPVNNKKYIDHNNNIKEGTFLVDNITDEEILYLKNKGYKIEYI